MSKETDIKQAQEYLGEPFLLDFSEYTTKVRNNLIFVGVLSIILITQNLELHADASLLGLKFKDFKMELIYIVLLFINIYTLIHFYWLTRDSFLAWKLRLTIGNKLYQGTYEDIDNLKKDPLQATLYSWWTRKIESINYEKKSTDLIEDELNNFIDKLRSEPPEGERIGTKLNEIQSDIKLFTKSFENYHNLISNTQIPVSLKRFDKCFHHTQTSQNLRWLLIEFTTPFAIGLYAFYLLIDKVF